MSRKTAVTAYWLGCLAITVGTTTGCQFGSKARWNTALSEAGGDPYVQRVQQMQWNAGPAPGEPATYPASLTSQQAPLPSQAAAVAPIGPPQAGQYSADQLQLISRPHTPPPAHASCSPRFG